MNKVLTAIFSIFFISLANCNSMEFKPYKKHLFSVLSENDALMLNLDLSHGYPDRYYSAGNALIYTSSEKDLQNLESRSIQDANASNDSYVDSKQNLKAGWEKPLGFLKYTGLLYFLESKRFTSFSISLNSKLYTPLSNEIYFNRNDRPYAGLLYLGFAINHRFKNAMESIALDMGLIGTLAAGNEIQNSIHDLIKVKRFKGWNNQVGNEEIVYLNLRYDYLHRFYIFKSSYFSSDILLKGGIGVGNIAMHSHVGGVLRAGYNLGSNFLVSRIDDYHKIYNDKFFVYLFMALQNRFVLFNRLITGTKNNFNDLSISHYIYDFSYGLNIGYKGFSLSSSFNYPSREFTTQIPSNYYGSIGLNFAF